MSDIDSSPKTSQASRLRKHYKPHRYGSALLVGLGIVANTAAVADLFTKHWGVLGLVTGTLAIVVGLYLLLSSWGKRIGWPTMLAVLIIVAGSVTLSLILQKEGYIDTATPTDNDNTTTNTTDQEEPAIASDKGKYYSLKANEGLDLDDGNESILVQQDSAKAPSDLYFSDWAFLEPSAGSFFEYQPPRNPTGNAMQDATISCRNLIDTSDKAKDVISPSSLDPKKSYCAVTTKNMLMLVSVEEIIDKSTSSASSESSVSFYVKLLK